MNARASGDINVTNPVVLTSYVSISYFLILMLQIIDAAPPKKRIITMDAFANMGTYVFKGMIRIRV